VSSRIRSSHARLPTPPSAVEVGDRVAQLVLERIAIAEVAEVENLDET
jgi:dUTPase